MSGILPGESTSINERFHRKLNRCVAIGVSIIGPELLIAILSVLFYRHNKSLEGMKHDCNSEIVPIAHPEEASDELYAPTEFLERIDNTNVDSEENSMPTLSLQATNFPGSRDLVFQL